MSVNHFLSIKNFQNATQVNNLFEEAKTIRRAFSVRLPNTLAYATKVLEGRIVATVFHERSTRTKMSFEAAVLRLGGKIIDESLEASSAGKGESLRNTLRTVSCYSDMIVCRHPMDGELQVAAKASHVPVINAGDGANEHPTQALLDWFTIWHRHRMEANGLNVMLTGDLLKSRTIRSFLQLGKLLAPDTRYFMASSSDLKLPVGDRDGLNITEVPVHHVTQHLPNMDVLYMTRIQSERHGGMRGHSPVDFRLRADHLKDMKDEALIMHPGPWNTELDPDVDTDERAVYHTEMPTNGLYVRMALLGMVMNNKLTS